MISWITGVVTSLCVCLLATWIWVRMTGTQRASTPEDDVPAAVSSADMADATAPAEASLQTAAQEGAATVDAEEAEAPPPTKSIVATKKPPEPAGTSKTEQPAAATAGTPIIPVAPIPVGPPIQPQGTEIAQPETPVIPVAPVPVKPPAQPKTTEIAQPEAPPKSFANSIGINLARIEAGQFKMGSARGAPNSSIVERPQHRVAITKPFYMGTHEVTNKQYEAFRPDHKNERLAGAGDHHPVVNVSWNDAVAFCRWLSEKEGKVYRLPTEAEWEFACRAGSATAYAWGDAFDVAKVNNSDTGPKPVGTYGANAWNLYDMHGNVWEWCSDWYSDKYYEGCPEKNPPGPKSGEKRVIRGGSWGLPEKYIRTAFRYRADPDDKTDKFGFRVCIEAIP